MFKALGLAFYEVFAVMQLVSPICKCPLLKSIPCSPFVFVVFCGNFSLITGCMCNIIVFLFSV